MRVFLSSINLKNIKTFAICNISVSAIFPLKEIQSNPKLNGMI
ncbi:hypothetical protein BOVAC2_3397 [Bacteroides ovatus]|nr:hypothetical protein BOVAC2_3397 [Bacteroides ovatus]